MNRSRLVYILLTCFATVLPTAGLLQISCAFAQVTMPATTDLAAQRDEFMYAVAKPNAARVLAMLRAGLAPDFNFNELIPGRSGESPLTMSIGRDQLDVARLLLEAGAAPSRLDGHGSTAIHRARSPEAMKLLARYKADLDAQDQRGMTAVALTAERGDLPTLDELLAAGARLDAPLRGTDLFVRAVEARHPEMVAALLARGLDPRTPPTKALWRLVEDGDTANVRLLASKGVDVNEQRGRETLLQRALFRKHWEIAGMLLDAGVTVRTEDATSVAKLASFHPPMLARLRAAGVDVNATGDGGNTALASLVMERPMAIRSAGGGTAASVAQNAVTGETVVTTRTAPMPVKEIPAPDNVARVKALLGNGADANRKIGEETPLMLAMRSPGKSRELAEALIDAGGRIDVDMAIPFSGERGEAGGGLFSIAPDVTAGMNIGPLTWALINHRPDIAIRLMERERKITRADRDLLYFAATMEQWDALVAAVPYGANVATANRAGVTPLMLAANAGRAEAVRALLGGGANVNARSAKDWPPFLEKNFMAQAGHGRGPPPLVGGYTALRSAREKGHGEVVKLLAAAGARE